MDILSSTAIEFNLADHSFKKFSIQELEMDLHDKNKIYWIHANLNQKEIFEIIVKKLQLPSEVIELCREDDSIPKVIDNDETITLQIPCLTSITVEKNKDTDFSNLIVHLTHKFCFTAASQPMPVLTEFADNYHKAIRYAKTPCFILFLMFDNIVNDYAKVLYHFELITDEMDLRVRTTHRNIYNKVMTIKQHVMKIKRYIISIREILMRISNRKISVVSDACRTSLYNLSNHAHMVAHETDSIRDMLNGLLDQIDNTLMQRMNETMRVLTAFAAIFLPLSLITGIYGMNFRWMPELEWKYGYFYALTLILACACMLWLLFKRKKWF
jgi:magnesium transporter